MTVEAATTIRPPLKWAGGKRWLIPHLLPYWERNCQRRLVEPFCGGLAVSLGLRPERALLNDRNPHLVNFYNWLKQGLPIDVAMINDARSFAAHRIRFNEIATNGGVRSAEAAQLFYYLNRTGFNGLCRFNRAGKFNVPFGSYKRIGYAKDFDHFRLIFADWEFRCGDFADLPIQPEDFIYADPPYDVDFTAYSKGGFTWEDQVRTAKWLSEHPGPVVLSNQATPRIIELYEKHGFQLRFLEAPRRISCNGDRTPAKEILAFRNLAFCKPAPVEKVANS